MKRAKGIIILSIVGILILGGCSRKNSEEWTDDVVISNKPSLDRIALDEAIKEVDQLAQSLYLHKTEESIGPLVVEDYNGLDLNKVSNYKIDAIFNPEDKTVSAQQKVSYINSEDTPLNEIYFHIYPNAFKTSAPMGYRAERVYVNGFSAGSINIGAVEVNNKENAYTIEGSDETLLKIPLERPLNPGEPITIDMAYKVVIPNCHFRFGYGDKAFNLANWYPIVAVYDREGWHLDPYYEMGEPFYSDVSNYDVTIRAPKDYEIASSGDILSEEIREDNKIWTIEARLVRDYTWVASQYFEKVELEAQDTIIKMYFLHGKNKIAIETAYDALRHFNRVFGKYPYGQLSIVETHDAVGAMEYAGIVFMGDGLYNSQNRFALEHILVHEIAHQWWYGVVGSNPIKEAWLDESFATYSCVIFYNEKYNRRIAMGYYENQIEGIYLRMRPLIGDNEAILRPSYTFNDTEYFTLTYRKGAMFLHQLREKFGPYKLNNILREYYTRYRFKNATTQDFIDVCQEVTGRDLSKLVDEWLYYKVEKDKEDAEETD